MEKRLLLFLLFLVVIVNVNANTAPVFNESKTSEFNLKEYQYFNYSLKAIDNDTGDNLTFIDLANLTNFKSFKMNSSGYIDFTVGYGDIGYFPVMLIVKDDSWDGDVITFNFNVIKSSNVRPSVVYEPNNNAELSMNENESKKFNVNATDNNNDTLTYTWFLDNIKQGDTIVSSYPYTPSNYNYYNYQSNYTSYEEHNGTHNITFGVNDGNVSTFVEWNIIVNDMDLVPYSIKPIPDISIYMNSDDNSIKLNEYFKDDDGDELNYIAILDPVGDINITITNITGEVLIEPDENYVGEKELVFKAIDPAGNSNSSNKVNLSVIKRSESSPRGEDADNKDRNKKQPVTEETPIQSNRVTGSTVNTPKANKLIETVLEKAGFNSDMFKKPNISWGIIGSLIIIAILVGVWIKIRINRRKHFGF